MAFEKPGLKALVERAKSDINARLPGADARLPASVLNVLAHVVAGAVDGLYRYQGYIAEQILPDTADSEYLDRHAGFWGLSRKAAAPAVGKVVVKGTTGTELPVGAQLKRADGKLFSVAAGVRLTGDSDTADVVSVEGGTACNTDEGVELTLVEAVVGLEAKATVAAGGLTGGTDEETDDALRERVLSRMRQPPRAGTEADYVAWALECDGITRAWCFGNTPTDGCVTVYVVADQAGIFPNATMLEAVQSYIDEERPVTAKVYVVSPIRKELNVVIEGLSPDTDVVRASVKTAINDFLANSSWPGGTMLVSQLRGAISDAAGEVDHVLVSPTTNVTCAAGELLVLGSVTWQ